MASKEVQVVEATMDSEKQENYSVTSNGNSAVQDWDKSEETALVRKIDYRIMPVLCLVFGASLLDRNNISSAYISGMAKDVGLATGNHYNVVLLVFFPAYAIFEFPSNHIIRRVGARHWMSFLIVFWGLMVLCLGFVKSWGPVAIVRVLLGGFEAGLFPGAIFLISSWYRTYETVTKTSVFYMAALIANGFGGILAYGLSKIKVGSGIYRQGWRWIFIIEGLATMLLGVVSFFTLGEFPEKAKWLNARERHIAKTRLQLDKNDSEYTSIDWKDTFKILCDWKLGFYSLQYYICGTSGYSMSYFLPIILKRGLGFNQAMSLILAGVPYFFAAGSSLILGWLSDRFRARWPFIFCQSIATVIGLVIMLYVDVPGVQYFGSFIAVVGSQANVPVTLAYGQNQTARLRNRGVVSAAMISMGAIGGITGSTIFRAEDAPRYLPGMWTSIGMQLALAFGTFAMSMYLKRQNRLADEGIIKDLEGVKDFRYVP